MIEKPYSLTHLMVVQLKTLKEKYKNMSVVCFLFSQLVCSRNLLRDDQIHDIWTEDNWKNSREEVMIVILKWSMTEGKTLWTHRIIKIIINLQKNMSVVHLLNWHTYRWWRRLAHTFRNLVDTVMVHWRDKIATFRTGSLYIQLIPVSPWNFWKRKRIKH